MTERTGVEFEAAAAHAEPHRRATFFRIIDAEPGRMFSARSPPQDDPEQPRRAFGLNALICALPVQFVAM